MTTDREVMQLALEALEYEAQRGNDNAYEKERTALRTALSRKALDELAEIDRELGLDDMQPEKQAHYMAVYRDGIKIIDPVTGDVSIGTPAAQPDLAKVGEVGIWEGKPMIDYAHPLIVLDDLLKEIHQLCIDKRYEEAMLLARESIYELSVLQCNLAVMAHKNV